MFGRRREHTGTTAAAGFAVGPVRVRAAAGTVVGNKYRANFDVPALEPDLRLAAVADGMGDGPGSTAAGQITMTEFTASIRRAASAGHGTGPADLRASVARIQDLVLAEAAGLPGFTGCTLTALVAEPDPAPDPNRTPAPVGSTEAAAWLVQIGDSRAYRLRAGRLDLLTVDHTEAWLGALYGWYPSESPQAAAARYRLSRYVGHPGRPEPDVLNVSLRPGDVYLLCTDGVAEQIAYHPLAALLAAPDAPTEIVARLLKATLDAGGHDNATAVVWCVDHREDRPAQDAPG
ncbi:protein phosphatase 2C domain-containing protein (plasmid) [Embleya sp. NBC_00888]|uniref:PP2C family protein-serine/threonine phosphatase n=1 Tax=Embleya sp. NBC_00888 TaxID=2975960 RepID=UPI002F91234C|nr:protein phosphatase 2C domain-containing protein [Embleya sp. NBC_00888]